MQDALQVLVTEFCLGGSVTFDIDTNLVHVVDEDGEVTSPMPVAEFLRYVADIAHAFQEATQE